MMFNFLVVRVRIELCEKRRAGESNPLHSLTVKLFEFGFSKPKFGFGWVWVPKCPALVYRTSEVEQFLRDQPRRRPQISDVLAAGKKIAAAEEEGLSLKFALFSVSTVYSTD